MVLVAAASVAAASAATAGQAPVAAPSTAVPTAPGASCTLPDHVDAPAVHRTDFVNRQAPYDHLKLVLSWSPEFCEAQKGSAEGRERTAFQCASANRFQWVVHGLWLENGKARSMHDNPRHCQQPPRALPAELVRKHLCTLPGASLMQNEWQAHGSCGWDAPDRYFADVEKIAATIARPSFAALAGRPDAAPLSLQPTTVGAISQAFVAVNGGRLRVDDLDAHIDERGALLEMRVCLDKTSFEPMRCPKPGAPGARTVFIRAPR